MKKHSQKESKTALNGKYEYREVICYKCRHRFMWEKSSQWQYVFLVEGKEDFCFKRAVCPECAAELMVKDGLLESMEFDKENSKIKTMILRGI